MDYRKTAQDVLRLIGGKENLISAAHCATRLRLVIADNKKCNKEALDDVDGVKGVFEASGQLQIIFGTGVVNKVYDEFIALAGVSAASKEDVKQAAASKANIFQRFIKMLGDIFVPIIPAIVASGFLMGIMNTLDFMNSSGIIAINTSGSLYVFATLFANTAYTFLPILIAVSAAKVFGGNPFLGAVIGMIMIHPSLQNAWTVATEGVQATQSVFGGLYSIDMVGYQGHVIPVIIAVWVMCFIEKRLHKVVPAMFDLFVTPLVSVFVTGYLTLAVIGPVFVTVENGVLNGIQWLISVPFGIGSFIMGALYAPTVVMGIHHMYAIIDLGQLSMYGLTFWLPLASAANIAQGAACLAVGVKSKKQKNKSLCLPSALSAFMGITEPAIFGVNIRFFRPFIAGCIGGACGAMYASVAHLGASGTGVTGIFGILLCLNMPIAYIIMFLISAGVAFGVSWLITPRALIDGDGATESKDGSEDNDKATVNKGVLSNTGNAVETAVLEPCAGSVKDEQETETSDNHNFEEQKFSGNNTLDINHEDNGINTEQTDTLKSNKSDEKLSEAILVPAPVKGRVVTLADTGDEMFASEALGQGIAIEPETGEVIAPFAGTVSAVMGHAIGLECDNGLELLIHVGIDTVNLNGKGFDPKVTQGDHVEAGALLMEFDISLIREAGYPVVTPVIVTNSDEYAKVSGIAEGFVNQREPVMKVYQN